MAYIPLTVISIILSHLPPVSISRFKCVSKPWCSLIHTPEFIKLQLHQANRNRNFFGFFINKKSHSSLVTVDYDTDYKKEIKQDIDFLENALGSIEIVGSCNGVICLCYNYGQLCLYNPVTKQSMKLPRLRCNSCLVGFGYDHKAGHFKVVASFSYYGSACKPSCPKISCSSSTYSPDHPVTTGYSTTAISYSPAPGSGGYPTAGYSTSPAPGSGYYSTADYSPGSGNYSTSTSPVYAYPTYTPLSPGYTPPPPQFMVYREGTDSWEKKESLPCYTVARRAGEHINGVVHWLSGPNCVCRGRRFIIAFDLVEDKCKEILLPDYEYSDCGKVELGVLGGCLSICTDSEFQNEAEIWMMKDYGVQESWEKVFRITNLDIARPLCFSKTGQVFLATNHQLLLYDPKGETVTILKCRIQDVCTYNGSCVNCDEDMMVFA